MRLKHITYWAAALSLTIFSFTIAEEDTQICDKEETIETKHQAMINGQPIEYRAVAGNIILRDENCKPTASLFYISYTKEGVADPALRPVTFCFNGGPGSSSVWLNLGLLGPKRVFLNENGEALPPYRLIDNEFSLLDVTDLVFIDPVSTGFSHAIPSDTAWCFHGFNEDVKSIGEFVRLYLSRNQRWESPKFIAGESYGTTRAVSLADYLHDHHYLYFNGIVLISSVLNYQALEFNEGNDLSYLLFLPSYTAAAWYHKKLSPDLQSNFLDTLRQSRAFVTNEYSVALFKGDLLPPQEKERVIQQLSRFTGLSPQYIERSNLRVDMMHFAKELLRDQKWTIGRFDSRFKGIDANSIGEHYDYDPSAEAVFGAFTSAMNQYLQSDLKWNKDAQYKILNIIPWNFGSHNQYLCVSDNLRSVMTKNPSLQVFVASGYYDLASPFFSTEYTFNHLGLEASLTDHVTMKYYDGGHMMFIHRPSLIQLKQDLSRFYHQTLKNQPKEEEELESTRR